MPATFTVKNIPDQAFARLKQVAASNHRSLNGEMLHTIDKIVSPAWTDPEEKLASIVRLRKKMKPNNISVADIARTIRQGRP